MTAFSAACWAWKHAAHSTPISDFSTSFDGDASNRAAAGVTDIAVLRDVADPNSIWTVYDADPALIEPMMSGPTRAEQMQAAGVISEPQVWVA